MVEENQTATDIQGEKPEIPQQFILNNQDYINMIEIIKKGNFIGEEVDYVSLLKEKLRIKLQSM